ncbi:GntP family permease [Staphylococcus shinii]|uniref:GntP family permease n=1 Tax=Staphylococcus shinii TaxID=2912228 RepID=UPI003F57BE17
MSTGYLIISLIVSVVIILGLIVKGHLNAGLALIIGSIVLGIMSGLDFPDIVKGIDNGFGGMLTDIGLPIGFGIILGKLLSDSGGANVIAENLAKLFPESKALYALAFTSFIISIPVFFDVTFVILVPIGIAMIDRINKSIGHIVGAICIGGGTAFLLVPPAPNPLAAAGILKFDVGLLIIAGLLIGGCSVIIATAIHSRLLDSKLWNPQTDESEEGLQEIEKVEKTDKAPSLLVSLIPILLPIILIILNTVTSAILGDSQPSILEFIGSKSIAMLIGAIAAFVVGLVFLGGKNTEESASEALEPAGIVFLITGAGGSFAEIIKSSGISGAIVDLVSGFGTNIILVLIMSWLTGVIFRQVTGSGTVAALTTLGIMSGVASAVDIHPMFIAMACLSGSLFGATINDSGFWIVSKISGFTLSGGIKTYTLGQGLSSVITIIITIIVACVSLLF